MDTVDEVQSGGEATPSDVPLTRRAWAARMWPVAKVVGGAALAALALWILYGRGGEFQDVLFDQLRWWWLVPLCVVEGASMVSFGILQFRLLTAGGLRPPIGPLIGTTVAGQAISNSFPGGAALATVYSFRWYRRFGADDTVAAWSLAGVFVGASLSLALVAALGMALAAEQGASLGLVPAVLVVLALSVTVAALYVHQGSLEHAVEWCLRISARVTGHPRPQTSRRIVGAARRVASIPLGWRGMATVTGWGLATWLFDCACFALAFPAVGAAIPWKGLLLAYGAGQLAANLPITPGGLGVVEGSIEVALVFFGGARATTVAAVFVYRLVSFWIELVVGWLTAAGLAVAVRRGRWERRAMRAPVATTLVGSSPTAGGPEREER